MALFNTGSIISIFYLNILFLCIQANPEPLDLQIHGQNNTTLLGQTLNTESSREAPEYEFVQLRVLSQRTADEQNVIRVHLAAFGKDIHLRLERDDDRSKRVKFSKASLTDSGVQLTEINVEDDDPGIPYIDLAQMTAVSIHYGLDGELLMDGVIGDDFFIKPAPTDKGSNDSISYNWDFSDHKNNSDVHSTLAPVKGCHVLYRNKRNLKSSFKVVDDSIDDSMRIDAFDRYRRDPNRPLHAFPEVLLMVDYDSYASHVSHGLNDAQIKRYYVSFMNGVDLRYRTLSDPKISLILTQIVIFKSRDDTPFLMRNLRYRNSNILDADFATLAVMRHMYTYRDNYPDIDIVVLLTKLIMCVKESFFNCDTNSIGLAHIKGACGINPKDKHWNAVALLEDNGGFDGILPAAHEIGHLLGAYHDGDLVKTLPNDYSNCSDDGYIMTTRMQSNKLLQFSECSIKQFKWFLNSHEASCLFNQPSYGNELDGSVLPGALLSLDEQCNRIYGTRANAWDSRVCVKLQCVEPERNMTSRLLVYPPAAEGSSCGVNLHCRDGKCVPKYQTYSQGWSMTPAHNNWRYIDSTTVSTTMKLPSTTVSKTGFKTILPRTTVKTVGTTTRLPWRTVTRVGTTTRLPWRTVTRVGTTTRPPWRTVTRVGTTTRHPGSRGEEACIEEKEDKFCKIYFRFIEHEETCRNERMFEDCCYSHAIFCKA